LIHQPEEAKVLSFWVYCMLKSFDVDFLSVLGIGKIDREREELEKIQSFLS
jgi:hypothetical protein